jgi:hypothetical protein
MRDNVLTVATMKTPRFDADRHVLRSVRVDRDVAAWRLANEERAARRWRAKWLIAIVVGVLLLIGVCLLLPGTAGATADAAVGCVGYEAAGRVTNVSRGYVAGYTFGKPTWFFGVRTAKVFRVGERVLVRGCQDTERQLRAVTLQRLR